MNFFRNNIISLISLILVIGGGLINVGVTSAKIESQEKAHIEFKVEVKEKIRDVEELARSNSERVNDKLDGLNEKMATIISWIDEQKRREGNNSSHNSQSK